MSRLQDSIVLDVQRGEIPETICPVWFRNDLMQLQVSFTGVVVQLGQIEEDEKGTYRSLQQCLDIITSQSVFQDQ